MRIIKETALVYFEFWGEAKTTAELLTYDELEMLEIELQMIYKDGIDETTLNDIFRFDVDWIANELGYEDFEEMYKERKKA